MNMRKQRLMGAGLLAISAAMAALAWMGSTPEERDITAAVLLAPLGFETIEDAREALAPRRALLQKRFITPVRRKRRDMAFARGKWQEYRTAYDWTEGGTHERFDWRV